MNNPGDGYARWSLERKAALQAYLKAHDEHAQALAESVDDSDLLVLCRVSSSSQRRLARLYKQVQRTKAALERISNVGD